MEWSTKHTNRLRKRPRPKSLRDLISRNWPLPTFFIGLVILGTALWYWRGPTTAKLRSEYLTDLAHAREFTFTNPYSARMALGALLTRRWRAPESRGEIYFLLGYANEKLAEAAKDDPETTRQYREKAIDAETQALQAGVPDPLRLPLHELFGTSMIRARETSKSKLIEANSALADALHRRNMIGWVLDRRELQIALTDPETPAESIGKLLSDWEQFDDVPAELKDITAESIEIWKGGHPENLRKLIDSCERIPGLGDNTQAFEIDDTLRTFIELEMTDDAIDRIHQERNANNLHRSLILGLLAEAAMLPSPAHTSEAQVYAENDCL